MNTLTFDADFFPAAVQTRQAAASVPQEAATPNLFNRMLEALGRCYYVETQDGQGYYISPI